MIGGPGGGGRTRGGPPARGPGAHGPGAFAMMPAAKAKDFRGSSRRLLGALRPEARIVAIVLMLAVVSVTFAIAGPKILGNATNIIFNGVVGKQVPAGMTKDQAVAGLRASGQDRLADMLASMDVVPGEGVDFDALARTLLVLVLVYVLSAAFSWGQAYLMAGVTQRTAYRLRRSVEEKLGRLPLAYFDRHPRGDILSRVTNDIDNISQTLQQSLTQLITGVLTVIGVLIMMITISPILAVISLLTVPLSVVVTIVIASRSQKQFVAQWDETGLLNGHVEEMHTGHSIVKVFGRQHEAIEAFDAYNDRMYEASFRAQFISGTIQPALNFLGNLNYVAIAVIGGVRVASGQMSLGDVQAFIQYSRQFTLPIVQTASIINVLQSAVASAERIFELLDEPEELPDPVSPKVLPEVVGRVALEGVSFRYEPDTPLIQDLNVVVEPGRTVAIVGPTGAGKTTLVNLLMRFYEIDDGRIALDGVDIREMRRDDLRCMFGMVLQDTWLFRGTIRENIAYGSDSPTEDQILGAARAAHVDHFVRTLADGYSTILDDEASNVSQGERQLLTIARAFLVDPPILILDEATSSVDTRTEVLIQRAMATLMEGRTSFVIAHRLSTIRDADTILVMDHGRIVEQGTHDSLMAQGGFYAELYASQFEEAEAEAGAPAPGARAVPAAFMPAPRPSAPAVAAVPATAPVVPAIARGALPASRVAAAGGGGDGSGGRPSPFGPTPAPAVASPPRSGVGWPAVVLMLVAASALSAAITLGSLGVINGGLRYALKPASSESTTATAAAPALTAVPLAAAGPTAIVGPVAPVGAPVVTPGPPLAAAATATAPAAPRAQPTEDLLWQGVLEAIEIRHSQVGPADME